MRYPELDDYCEIAAQILGITPEQVSRLPNIPLAASALAAPRAGFGDTDFYPTLLGKSAVLLERLARNHPLPDGNKRTAFVVTLAFLEDNGTPVRGADLNDVAVVERIAAGEMGHEEIVTWLEERTAD